MIFIVVGPDAVISFVMRSKGTWKMLVLDNTSFGVQFLADVNVTLYVAMETCVAIPDEEAKMSMSDMTPAEGVTCLIVEISLPNSGPGWFAHELSTVITHTTKTVQLNKKRLSQCDV